jgi:hypothetical protein
LYNLLENLSIIIINHKSNNIIIIFIEIIILFSFIKYLFILWYIPLILTIIQNFLNFALYFHLGFVHAHIILWINDIDVDHITNEIVTMVPTTINEQSEKFILPNNEHDLTFFELEE